MNIKVSCTLTFQCSLFLWQNFCAMEKLSKISLLIILLIFSNVQCISALKVYSSVFKPVVQSSGLSGIKYKNPNQNETLKINGNSLTICGRFNFLRLGTNSYLLYIWQPNNIHFLKLRITYPYTFLHLGNVGEYHAYSSWILQDITNDYVIFRASTWHHICLAYDSKRSHIAFVKVRLQTKLVVDL